MNLAESYSEKRDALLAHLSGPGPHGHDCAACVEAIAYLAHAAAQLGAQAALTPASREFAEKLLASVDAEGELTRAIGRIVQRGAEGSN